MAEFDPKDPFNLEPAEAAELELQPDFVNLEEEEEETASAPSATASQAKAEPTQETSTEEPQQPIKGKSKIGSTPLTLEGIAGAVVNSSVGKKMAPQLGTIDFGTDLVNVVPGVNLPKIPKYENEMMQAGRDISSVLIPTLFGGGALTNLGKAANARVGWSIGQNKFVQWLGTTGVDALAGLAVDSVSRTAEDDNLSGTLKKSFPKTFDFIPDSWATLEGDSPDLKRQKNMQEGVGLGFLPALAEGAGVLINGFRGTGRTIKTYGESAESIEWLKKNSKADPTVERAKKIWNDRPAAEGVDVTKRTQWDELDPDQQQDMINFYRQEGMLDGDAQEVIENALIRQEEALDEVGMFNISKGADPEQPIRGVDDLFEYTESGSRTVDDLGIVGASIDNVRIAKNLDTSYGRLGNVVSESAMEYAGESAENAMNIVTGLARQLDEAGPIGQKGKNWNVTPSDTIKQGDITAALMFEPGMTVKELQEIVSPMMVTNEAGAVVLSEDGYAGVMKALGMYRKELSGMSIARAQALTTTSVAGQVSDLAESARLMEGTAAKQVAEDRILENMRFLMMSKNVSDYYLRRKRTGLNLFKSNKPFQPISSEEVEGVLAQITKDTDRFFTNARTIRETNPQAFDNLMLAYELTDGKIDSMYKLSKYIDDSTTNLGKAFIDFNPETENMLISGIWSNIYNSVLSGMGTPVAAMAGNLGGIISKPLATFGGALMNKDLKTFQRSWMAYSAVGDTLSKALPYAGSVFRKASQDPDAVRGITRTDLAMARQDKMELLKNVARSEADKGNTGLQNYVKIIELLDNMARFPLLRLGPNALTAVDGLTSAFIANANSRFMALDELAKMGKKATRADVKAIADKRYAEMFDSNGLITDKASKWASDELALNINSPIASGFQDATKYLPILKPFMMFQTTGVNMVEMMGKYSPTAIAFQRDVNDLAFTPLRKLLSNEDKVNEILTTRGYDISTMDPMSKANRIAEMQAETKGRKAIGTLAITSALGLVMNDRLTGDGLYDKETQRVRAKMNNWKPRSIKGPDGKWYSYEQMGPLADWMAAVANVADNFDMLGETAIENLYNKLTFILASSITDRTALSGLEPLMKMLSGDGGAVTRWAPGFLNSIGPLASARNDFGKLLSEGLREVDTDFMQYLQNRNLYTEHLNPDNRLPYVYSPIDGKVANSYGFLQRLWNATNVVQVHEGQSEEQEFLTAFEYDLSTTFQTRKGVKLSPKERSSLFKIMGEDGYFKTEIREIMKDAKDWKVIAELHNKRRSGVSSEDLDSQKWRNIGTRIRQAQNRAEEFAFYRLDAEMRNDIEARIVQQQARTEASTEGMILDETLNIRK